jgi:hypothetical protein
VWQILHAAGIDPVSRRTGPTWKQFIAGQLRNHHDGTGQVMALNYITLVLDLADGTGTPLATGQALLNPSAQLTDTTDDMIVTKAQLSAKLAGSYPQVRLLATDNTALRLQDGRGRSLPPDAGEPTAVHVLPPGQPLLFHRDQRQTPAPPQTVNLTDLSPGRVCQVNGVTSSSVVTCVPR